MDFGNINYLAVLVAAVAAFILGSVWYGPLFGKTWQKELGYTVEYIKKGNMAQIFGLSFILTMVSVFGLAFLFQGHGENEIGWYGGLWHGLFIGLLFAIPIFGVNYLYQRRSFKLFLIDAFYWVVWLGLAGLILGLWP